MRKRERGGEIQRDMHKEGDQKVVESGGGNTVAAVVFHRSLERVGVLGECVVT